MITKLYQINIKRFVILKLDKKSRLNPMYSAYPLKSQKNFWSSSKNKDEQPESLNARENNDQNKSIVAQYGDNSPVLNPILLLPTFKRPIFPGYLSAMNIKNEVIIESIVKHKDTTAGYIGIFLRTDHDTDFGNGNTTHNGEVITNASQIHKIGTFAQIQSIIKGEFSTQLVLMGHRRVSIDNITTFGPPAIANVSHWKRPPLTIMSPNLKAYTNEVISVARELIKMSPLLQEQLHHWVSRFDFNDPYKLADFATALTTADGIELQKVLEASDAEERLSLTLELLVKEKEMAKLQQEITKQVEEKVSKQQREYFLREQLKNIKKELGMEKDGKEDLIQKYNEKVTLFESKQVSNDALNLMKDEINKLSSLDKSSPEFNVTRSYLDWLVAIPWGNLTDDSLDLSIAKAVLDEDHFGLDDIKLRILEYIAIGKLKGNVSGKIICFIGPPGVGKTSIAKSIAKSLNKKFYRFSVGGLTDTAEIKGHRRTYIGAMPGKPIQCLKSTGCLNPLILIDEIDKLGKSYNGDPASALLELLDPNQNSSFVDHYLDIPVDFSKVLFVCTANDESTIPGPLKDRMEIIRLTGYDIPEKVSIASKYLVPKALEECGLSKDNYKITEDALYQLVRNYSRESGVRSLDKMIDKIARKLAYRKVESNGIDNDDVVTVTIENLEKYAGKPIFIQDNIYETSIPSALPVGVVMGLAWSPLGGSPIFIETAALPSQSSNRNETGINVVTGQLGSVMKESVNIAYTFARQFVHKKDNNNVFFSSNMLHLHVPEGAVSKDGPSAGVAMTTSLVSIATNKTVRPKVAMTGELSLTGKVLPVGGIKEKILAAKRSGANIIILPSANKRDFDELPEYVKEDISIHFASEYQTVYDIAFGP